MKKPVFSRTRVLIAALVLICAVALIAGVTIARNQKIVFYSDFPFRIVEAEYKAFSIKLFADHSDSLYKLYVAQDSRSAVCIRFVVVSDGELECNIRQSVLADIMSFKSTVPYSASFPNYWEVFFCQNEQLYDVYVTPYVKNIDNGVDTIDSWYTVPQKYVRTISFTSIRLMLQRTYQPMYYIGSIHRYWESGEFFIKDNRTDFDEQTPNIPFK